MAFSDQKSPHMQWHFAPQTWDAEEVSFVPGELREPLPLTAVGCYAFSHPGFMVLPKSHRGWDYPGGHLEEGEDALAALHREVSEEIDAVIIGEPILVGHRIIHKTRHTTHNARYPDKSAIAHYVTFVQPSETFRPQLEVTDRCIIPHQDIASVHQSWTLQNQHILDYIQHHCPGFFD